MKHSEKEYIALCKRLIEEKFHFENENGMLRQRDLQYLADCIAEKSGIILSLSTLKRLWKKDYGQTPHPPTLQALVSVLGYKDWQQFKEKEKPAAEVPPIEPEAKRRRSLRGWVLLPIIVAVPVVLWLSAFLSRDANETSPVVKGPVTLTGNKTVSRGVPSTIIFNYDVTNVEADSFFFQQSWNPLDKVKLDPKGHYYSNIYYYPGFHKAKLIANDSILRRFRVHIITDGWLPLARYRFTDQIPIYLEKPLTKGALHITRQDLLTSNVNVDQSFVLSYYNVREFENTHSDNFSLETRVVCDSINTIACPGFEVVVICEAHIFFLRMMGKGCERDIGVKMGEVYHDGVQNDLSSLGRNLHKWQNVKVQVENKRATIYLDEEAVHAIDFKNDFGKVVGLTYNFLGTGAIDYVRLRNGDNKMVLEDEFEE
jgi:hypothetical protein